METQKTEWTEEDWQNLKLSDNFLFGYVMQNEDGLPLYTVRHAVEENPEINYDDGRRIMIFNTTAWKKSLAQNRKDMLKYIQCGNGKFESEKVSDFAAMVTDAKTKNLFRRNYMTLSLKIREMEMDAMDKGRKEGYDDGYNAAQAQLAADQAEIAQRDSEIAALKARIAQLETSAAAN